MHESQGVGAEVPCRGATSGRANARGVVDGLETQLEVSPLIFKGEFGGVAVAPPVMPDLVSLVHNLLDEVRVEVGRVTGTEEGAGYVPIFQDFENTLQSRNGEFPPRAHAGRLSSKGA